MHQVYDVSHNTAKLERHVVDGRPRELLVHRKGATRAFGRGCAGLPEVYRETGPAGDHRRQHGDRARTCWPGSHRRPRRSSPPPTAAGAR